MMKLKGIITALITPFYQGEIDQPSFIKLIHQQMDEGVDGLVINGTTGESPTLNEKEVEQIVQWTRHETAGQVPLILGIGHNNTQQAVKNTIKAQQLHMDGVLAVVPYYNKPSQTGLKKHFKEIARHSSLPVILYNVPARTQVGLDIPTVLELTQEKQIQAIKEASGNISYIEQLSILNSRSDFYFLSGDDCSFLEFASKGGHGVVSVASHFLLKEMKHSLNKACSKDQEAVTEFHKKYDDLLNLLYSVSNPMMIKQVMYFKQVIRSPELRLPLCEPDSHLCEQMKTLLNSLGLLQ